MPGIELDLDRQVDFIRSDLKHHIDEFSPPRRSAERGAYFTDNGSFEAVDGELAYAMVRHLRPKRVIEIGSGFSTLALAAACRANEAEGSPSALVSIDPYPRAGLLDGVSGLEALRQLPAQDVALEELTSLAANDVLFVDSSHVVRTRGEVNLVVLEVLPVLDPGVIVHFHDLFLPYEYHRGFLEGGRFFTEQYLVQAFLAMNPAYEVVLAAHALLRDRRPALAELVPSLGEHQPSSFWIRRRG
jgi:predicted O-methyltransferase YrrM